MAGDGERALAAYSPDCEFDARLRPEGGVYHGHAGVIEAMRVWIGAWEDWHLEVSEYIDAGDGKVLSIGRESGTGKGSGVTIDQTIYVVFTVRDGQIARWQGFLDEAEARQAAGLGDQPFT